MWVELRGFEPLVVPAKMGPEQRWMLFGEVTWGSRELRLCVGVLRHVTVLGLPIMTFGYVRRFRVPHTQKCGHTLNRPGNVGGS
jgi:hypothetical protein